MGSFISQNVPTTAAAIFYSTILAPGPVHYTRARRSTISHTSKTISYTYIIYIFISLSIFWKCALPGQSHVARHAKNCAMGLL